jgi:hypothetical protein
MIVTILLVWLLLTYPMVKETLRHMEKEDRPERNSLLFQIILLGQSMIYVPYYYFLMIMGFILKVFKNK